ncbi:hypothetical protein, partial [Trichormus variabilis]
HIVINNTTVRILSQSIVIDQSGGKLHPSESGTLYEGGWSRLLKAPMQVIVQLPITNYLLPDSSPTDEEFHYP